MSECKRQPEMKHVEQNAGTPRTSGIAGQAG